MTTATSRTAGATGNPWHALWAMMLGFFMIMLDATIVAIANPTIMVQLRIGYDTVVWVTSSYLLGYAVVLLVAGRLGDRFGPKNVYLFGLLMFTAASAWCGLAGSAAMLIAARAVQGVGAGLLTPQTLSAITRIFPVQRRGAAMSAWGATAGVAGLVGPLAGGLLVDNFGWEWIFFVNIPVGVVGLALAAWLVPELPVDVKRFDLIGVGLSGVGMFLLVFGLQQGQSAHWEPWIWAVLVAGVGFMWAFAYWQSINRRSPLIPLRIFRDRDFSLCNVGVGIIAFATTAMMLPLTFYAQGVCGLSPTRSAVLLAPMALISGLLAPFVGRIIDRAHPLPVLGFGFSVLAISMTWLSIEMNPVTPIWRLVLPLCVMGVGMAFVWSPLAATATRKLPIELSGASSGVYNATRQLGAVLGSAGMAAFMTSRIGAEMPTSLLGGSGLGGSGDAGIAVEDEGVTLQLPDFLREPFSAAMSQSMLLPAFIALFGIVAALFLVGIAGSARSGRYPASEGGYDGGYGGGYDGDLYDDDFDDDEYVEYILRREPDGQPVPHSGPAGQTRMVRDPRPVIRAPQREPSAPSSSDDADPQPLVPLGRHPRAAGAYARPDNPIGSARHGAQTVGEQGFRPAPVTQFGFRPVPVTEFAPHPNRRAGARHSVGRLDP